MMDESHSWQEVPLSTPAPSRTLRMPTPATSSFADRWRSFSEDGVDSPAHFYSNSSFGADDSGVAFGDDDKLSGSFQKGGNLLASHLGLRIKASSSLLGHFSKSHSADSLTSSSKAATETSTPPRRERSFHGSTRTSRPPIALHNPFGTREWSALSNETRWSDAGSTASSPDRGGPARNRKTFASPARKSQMNGSSNEGTSYLTPQNFKSVKPLQAAFMSTGLVSKRNRTRENSDGSVNPAENFSLPPKPNFGSALGLREVVAAANAHAAANTDKAGHTMPDTPVKKSTPAMMPFPVPTGISPRPSPQASLRVPSPLGMHSPTQDSISSGCSAESPLLPDGCDSPTLNLMSLSPPSAIDADRRSNGWPAFSTLPRSRRSPMSMVHTFHPFSADDAEEDDPHYPEGPASPSVQLTQQNRSPPPTTLRKGKLRPGQSSYSFGRKSGRALSAAHESMRTYSPAKAEVHTPTSTSFDATAKLNHRRAQLCESEPLNHHRPPYARARNSLGLQRKTSTSLMEQIKIGPVPMTPTRTAAQIKWFEAAQVVTTPSPSSRRHAARQLRAQRKELLQTRRGTQLSESVQAQDTPFKAERSLSGLIASPVSASPVAFPINGGRLGNRLETCFTIESVIGTGEFSEVVKAEEKSTGCAYAIKRMKKAYTGPKDRLRRLEEVDVLRHLSIKGRAHPNIIGLIDAWEEEGHLFVQLELCPLGTLAFFLEEYGQQVGALDEPRLWKILAELSSGLAHIHANQVLHLDIKPANIFITEHGTLKIGDFGMATRWPPPDAMTIMHGAAIEATDMASAPGYMEGRLPIKRSFSLEREGDREYLAPEVMFSGQYGKPADIFSLGLILLEAAGNVQLPDNGEPWQKLRKDDFSDVDLSFLSGPMLRMLSSLLASDPAERPTVEEIVDHPVMEMVRSRMARGLLASELDQLPDFNMPSSGSGLTASNSESSIYSNASSRTAGRSDGEEDSDMQELSRSGSALGLGRSGITSSASNCTISTTSSMSSNLALNVRGALIQESEQEFMNEVLESDAMEKRMRDAATASLYSTSASSFASTSSSSCLSPSPMPPAKLRMPLTSIQPREQRGFSVAGSNQCDAMDLDD